jgi:HK97 family phage portal protein
VSVFGGLFKPVKLPRLQRALSWAWQGLRAGAGGQALPPWDDYWFQRPGFDSAAGMAVSPETAMRLSTVFSCIRVRSESLAACPCIIFKRLPNGGKERAPKHPLYKIFNGQPNIWQTSLEFFEMMQAHLDLRGNAFAEILPGPNGPVDQLLPLHPDLVQVYRLPSGRLKYEVRNRWSGEIRWLLQEEMLHIRGLSSDGLVGLSPIAVQRETVGTGLGMQDYAARFVANDSKPPFVLEHPGKFKDDAARKEFRESVQKSQTQGNRGKVMILESGMKATALGVSNKDAQFLEAKNATAVEICGIYRVPPHKVGMLDRATHSNIEHQGIEFVSDCIKPMAVRWQSRLNCDLVDPINEALGNDEYFVEFLTDGLLRGDMKSRFDAYSVAVNAGFYCPNDAAMSEGMNPIPEEKGGNDYRFPINYKIAGAPEPALLPAPGAEQPQPSGVEKDDQVPNPPLDEGGDQNSAKTKLLDLFAREAAGRVVRKETAALRKALTRAPEKFMEEAAAFYSSHVTLIAQTMLISESEAKKYAAENLRMLTEASDAADKFCVLDWIEDTAAQELAALALGKIPDRAIHAVEGALR